MPMSMYAESSFARYTSFKSSSGRGATPRPRPFTTLRPVFVSAVSVMITISAVPVSFSAVSVSMPLPVFAVVVPTGPVCVSSFSYMRQAKQHQRILTSLGCGRDTCRFCHETDHGVVHFRRRSQLPGDYAKSRKTYRSSSLLLSCLESCCSSIASLRFLSPCPGKAESASLSGSTGNPIWPVGVIG